MTSYSFDKNGNLSTIAYPSGRTVSYALDVADRTTGVTTTPVGGRSAETLASGISHKPFGGISSLTYGNGLARTIGYDQQYRIASIQTGAVQNVAYTHDPNGNITAITDVLNPTKNKSFGYDSLDRLTSASGPWGSLSWTYDPVGNRQTQVENGATSTYSYQSGTNKLTGVSGPSPLTFSLDDNGNTTTENAKTYTFNQNNRLIKASESGTTKGQYTYNANGQRATKTASGSTTVFHHDQSGSLIAESSSAGSTIAEYVWLEGQPLAKLDSGGTRYVHPDHLGTPQIMTSATKTIVWQIEAKPFGDGASITGAALLNLRFPGQYFDAETGLHQNWWREYHPRAARYIQADPLGLYAGLNLYLYVLANPQRLVDITGLECWTKTDKTVLGYDYREHITSSPPMVLQPQQSMMWLIRERLPYYYAIITTVCYDQCGEETIEEETRVEKGGWEIYELCFQPYTLLKSIKWILGKKTIQSIAKGEGWKCRRP